MRQAEVSPETYEAKVLQLQTLYERKRLMREQVLSLLALLVQKYKY